LSLETTKNKDKSLYPNQEADDEDDDSWQVSYLDIITILLGFLVILLSFSELNNGESFSVSELFKSSQNETEFITTPIDDIKKQLESLLEPEIEQGKLEIYRELNDVRIRFKSDDLYNSGSAQLQDSATEILNRVLAAFKLISYDDFEIDVEGHTDNVPISSSSFDSNWELSTSRASNVVKYFNRMGISQERLKASGYADSRPIVEFDQQGNPYPANKDRNRRVVLRLFYSSPEQYENNSSDSTNTDEDQTSQPEKEEVLPATTGLDVATAQVEEQISSNQNEESESTQASEASEASEETSVNTTPKVNSSKPETKSGQKVTKPENTENFENGCRYSIQVGGFESFSNSFNFSKDAEEKTGLKFEILYNNSLFSSRTASNSSFLETIALQETIEEKLDNDQITGFVQQCYDDGRNRPQPLNYQIQLAFFQNEQNALSFIETLAEKYNIDAVIEQKSLQAFTLLTKPIHSISATQKKLEEIKSIDILNGAFIKFDPSTVSEYSFTYQIQLGSFSTKQEVDLIAQRLRTEMNVQSSIKTFSNGRYYLVTRPYTDWDEVSELYNILDRDSSELSLVIYLLERV
tara:strand:+ start:12990 stop:14729 length:1740 start_codon:yes stop_codon:yes gene_type:complete